ncbi:MAG: glycosyltransferase family 39 protein [Chloroflexi bacterium]|nr:glycosyltransferase family 39 protein [Chloroflexota bacterium]
MLLTFTWVAFLLRTLNLARQSLWRDEVDAIRFSSWPLSQLLGGLFRVGHNGPLFFLLLRPWRSLTGDSEFALRYPAALLGTLAVPLGFVLARQLGFSRRARLLLSLLLATSPYLVWYGQEAKMYTLLLALVSLAFIAYLKALTGFPPSNFLILYRLEKRNMQWFWWSIFVVATTLSFYTHILAPLMLMVYGFVALLNRANVRRRWRSWLISMACLTLPYLPLAVWQAPLLLNGFQSGHPFYPLDKQIFILLQLYSSGLVRFIGLTAIILYVFLFLCGLFLPRPATRSTLPLVARQVGDPFDPPFGRRSGRRPATYYSLSLSRLILAGWTLLPPLIVFLISLRVAVFEDRYLIYIVPSFYLLTGVGLLLVRQYSRLLAGLCLGLLLVINLLGIWQQQRQPLKADFRAVASYLSHQAQPPSTIMIQLPYLQYTFDYYYRRNYTLLEGLWTNNSKSEAMVDAEMTALTAGLPELWLVVSEEEAWDSRRLTRAWLDAHAQLVDQAHFVRVDVYHYYFQPDRDETQRLGQEVE